jgi:hypothetical protein
VSDFVETVDGEWLNLDKATHLMVKESTRRSGTWVVAARIAGEIKVLRDGFARYEDARDWLADLLEDAA